MNVPAVFDKAITDYGIPDDKIERKQLLSAYEKLVQYGRQYKLHMAQQQGGLLEFAEEASTNHRIRFQPWIKTLFERLDTNHENAAETATRNPVMSIANLNNPKPERRALSVYELAGQDPPTQSHSKR